MELHERLVAARKAAGYESAADAAAALTTPYPTYAGHENGSSGFKHKTAVIYARKFGVSLEWLLTGRGKMFKKEDSPLLQETIELLREADPEFQEVVSVFLKSRKAVREPKPVPELQDQRPSNRK